MVYDNIMKRKKTKVFGIPTSTNEAYGKVIGGERNEGYELPDVQNKEHPPPTPAATGEMYEVPLLPAALSQPLPTIPSSLTAGAEEDTVYDVIPGDV